MLSRPSRRPHRGAEHRGRSTAPTCSARSSNDPPSPASTTPRSPRSWATCIASATGACPPPGSSASSARRRRIRPRRTGRPAHRLSHRRSRAGTAGGLAAALPARQRADQPRTHRRRRQTRDTGQRPRAATRLGPRHRPPGRPAGPGHRRAVREPHQLTDSAPPPPQPSQTPPVDDAPVAVNDTAGPITEDSAAVPIDVLANDSDIDAGSKTVTSVRNPAGGTAVITGGGTGMSYTLNGGSTATVAQFAIQQPGGALRPSESPWCQPGTGSERVPTSDRSFSSALAESLPDSARYRRMWSPPG